MSEWLHFPHFTFPILLPNDRKSVVVPAIRETCIFLTSFARSSTFLELLCEGLGSFEEVAVRLGSAMLWWSWFDVAEAYLACDFLSEMREEVVVGLTKMVNRI